MIYHWFLLAMIYRELSVHLWQYEEMIFFMWNNTHYEILHKFLVLMIYNTWLFWKKCFFPKFLGPISRSGEILALLTVKNEQKKFLCLFFVFIWYLVPEKHLATTIWGHAQETHLYLLSLHKLYNYRNEILKCCNIYQTFSQIPSQKTVHDGNKLWTHYPFPPIIWLSKVKYIVNHHQAPWYFFSLSVKPREVYHNMYLKALQNHTSLTSLASYWN